jgi:hypothetical protein
MTGVDGWFDHVSYVFNKVHSPEHKGQQELCIIAAFILKEGVQKQGQYRPPHSNRL